MGALSHDQFADHVNAGGASRLLHGQQEVPLERGKFAVSDVHHERTLPAPVTGADVAQHHSELLGDSRLAHPDAMQGGWKAGDEVYLDSSALVVGRKTAVKLGAANGQKAVFSHSRALNPRTPDTEVYMKPPKPEGKQRVVGSRREGFTLEQPAPPRVAGRRRL